MTTKANLPNQAEMYDEDGQYINEELFAVKFVDEEDPEQDDYY